MNPYEDKNVLLGITGSIAAYKAAMLASKLAQSGAKVNTIFTEAATKFISPLTFQAVTGEKAYTDQDLWGNEAHVLHVGLAHQADLLVIAPATATTLAKLASGIADNLLTLTALACGTGEQSVPLIIAPAMDAGMYSHTATQENIRILQQRGVHFIGPEKGHLASGLIAKGRMTEPTEILGQIGYRLSRNGPLSGKKIVVTAGGTQESIDPVRYITNRSSGKQGYAIAQQAVYSGANVVLISAPTNLEPPAGAEYLAIRSAGEMAEATLIQCQNADALIMAAAVSDFRPAAIREHKIKKIKGVPNIELANTTDILAEISIFRQEYGYPLFVVGFAAETDNLISNAEAKLKAKNLDILVANDITAEDAGFSVDTNRVTLLFADGQQEKLPLLLKSAVAERIIQELTSAIL
jgi:phosphopantothenoylcysteine decarboxylase/phosphopantothenate--cysteine ligase